MSGIDATLQSLASALGGRDPTEPGNPYVLGDDGLGCLRDIKRWLQLYDEKRDVWDVKSALASINLVSDDLCPILASWTLSDAEDEHKRRISLACVEILVPLTWPIELDADADEFKSKQYPNLRLAQSSYKRSILFDPEKDILGSIMRVTFPSLEKPRRERTERDSGILRLVVYLLRNLVAIDESRHRSETILAFQKSNALEFLCVLASGMGEDFVTEDVIVLDIIYNLVRGVNVTTIFDLSKAAQDTIKSDLTDLLTREKSMKTTQQSKAHTRHNRFGTMVSVVQDQRRFTVASQTAIVGNLKGNNFEGIEAAKKWNRPSRNIRSQDDLDVTVMLNTEARRSLGEFTATFLDAGFNPLFMSLLKALEHDNVRVSPMNRLQYLYLQGWSFRALRERGRAAAKKAQLGSDFSDDADYGLIASMMEGRATIMLRKIMRESSESKLWKETHASMECFKELLLTIDAMSLSSNTEYQEIAENLQSNLYYEEANLELIVNCVKYYTNQSFGYLNACTSLATVLLKMLEKFASTKSHMFVRARRQRQKKRTAAIQTPADSDDETAEANAREAVKEKAFSFAKFESKFMHDGAISAFLSLLQFYIDLTPEQIKRVINFFHRVFVKQKIESLIYRMDVFELLNRMIKDKANFSMSNPARKEVENFAMYMFKRFTRTVEDCPALAWEILFDKLSNDMYYLTHDTNKAPVAKKAPRPPAEFEVRPGLTHEEQIKVAIGVLLDDNQSEFLNWLKSFIEGVISRRQAWEAEHRARADNTTAAMQPTPSAEVLNPDDSELSSMLFKNGRIRLLLKLLRFERDGAREDATAQWFVPASHEIDTLQLNLNLIKRFTMDPPSFGEKAAAEFIRRQVTKRQSYDSSSSSSSSSSENEAQPKASRARKPTRRHREQVSVTEEELDERRRKRDDLEEQRKQQIKSSKYVLSEDDEDDEQANAIFFAAEEALRERQKLRALGLLKEHSIPQANTQTTRAVSPALSDDSVPGSANKENTPNPLFLPDDSDDDLIESKKRTHNSTPRSTSTKKTKLDKRIARRLLDSDDE